MIFLKRDEHQRLQLECEKSVQINRKVSKFNLKLLFIFDFSIFKKIMSNLKSKSCVALTLLLFAINITVRVESAESGEIYANSSSSIVKSRMKRYLIFQPGSRILVRKAFQ